MEILKTDVDNVDESIIDEAVRVLSDGGIVLYPTDTVYGLGANIFNNEAVRKVFAIKQRSLLKPLSILVSDMDAINLVAKVSNRQREIMDEYLPGPYTFILKKRSVVPRVVTSGSSFVGVRVPDNEIACGMASIFPITTTSANVSDKEVLSTPCKILKQLDCDVDLVIDAGPLKSEKPSSIIDITSNEPILVRK